MTTVKELPPPTTAPVATLVGAVYTFKPDETTGMDTFLYSDAQTTNYATDPRLGSGEDHNAGTYYVWRTLIKFAGLITIPTDKIVISAYMRLWTQADNSSNSEYHDVFIVLKDWVENQTNWNRASTAEAWNAQG